MTKAYWDSLCSSGLTVLVLLLIGVGFFKRLHHDLETQLQALVDALRVDPDNRYLGALLAKLSLVDDKKIEVLSGLTFAYSAVFLVEGTGLFFEKRWAEYLTIVATVSFIPVEIYELLKAPSLLKCVGDQCGNRHFPNSKGARVER